MSAGSAINIRCFAIYGTNSAKNLLKVAELLPRIRCLFAPLTKNKGGVVVALIQSL